jgi:hypothetical protein
MTVSLPIMNIQISFTVRLLLILAVATLSAFPAFALAASYTVAPLVINHDLEKRDIIEEKITISNKDSRVITIFPSVNEVTVNDGGAIQAFVSAVESDRTKSITSWLEISRAQIELKPGESKELTLTIRVNPEVVPGEYNAFVGFAEGSNRPESEKMLFGNLAPGTVVRIGVDKQQNQFLRLEKFAVERFVKKDSEGVISLTLQNPGEDPVVPQGEVIFYDNNGVEVATVPLNTDAATIKSKESVSFALPVPDELAMGKYKAFLSAEYGEHQKASLNDTAFFYVLPLRELIAIFALVLVLAILLALYVHRRYDREEDDYGASDVPMYIRATRSEGKEHDIDLSQKNN